MPRRSCHVSVGRGIVYLKLLISVLGYRMMLITEVEVNETKRKSRRARAREEERGDVIQLEQWSRISCHDTVVPTHALCLPDRMASLSLT